MSVPALTTNRIESMTRVAFALGTIVVLALSPVAGHAIECAYRGLTMRLRLLGQPHEHGVERDPSNHQPRGRV